MALKTGTTDKAGESFVVPYCRKGMRVITVVLNADHQDNNPYARFTANIFPNGLYFFYIHTVKSCKRRCLSR